MNYKNLLYEIQQQNAPLGPAAGSLVYPKDELYQVDLNKRIIYGPEFISVQDEHRAEIIYFILDRYHGNMDLAQTNCIIQYMTNDKKVYYYPVPFCDVHSIQEKMIIPWSISASATAAAGDIKYVIRFYLLDDTEAIVTENFNNWDNLPFTYSLSTLTATSKVLVTLPLQREDISEDGYALSDDRLFELVQVLNNMVEDGKVYWNDV